jgi:hypothetical protein
VFALSFKGDRADAVGNIEAALAGDLVGFVIAPAGSIAFDLVLGLDRFARFGIDEFAVPGGRSCI